jgi:serine/threonine-protein kinase
MELELLVNKCLAKDADRRYQNAVEMVVDLETVSDKLKSGKSTILRTSPLLSGAGTQPTASPASFPGAGDQALAPYRVIETLESGDDTLTYRAEDTNLQRSVAIRILSESEAHKAEKWAKAQRHMIVGLASGLILALLLSGFLWLGGSSPDASERRVRRFSFPVEELQRRSLAISPDGRHIVYAAGADEPALWVRDLDSETPRRLEGTQGAESPFWSPDSRFIAFAAGTSLKRVAVSGGEATDLSDLPARRLYGGSWSPNGERIVFSSGPPMRIYEVPDRGGTPRNLFEVDESEESFFFVFPKFIPSQGKERAVTYNFGPSSAAIKIGLLNLETGKRNELLPGTGGDYLPTGHLLFKQGLLSGSLMVLPFSLETLTTDGDAYPILNQVDAASLSPEGTLVYTSTGKDDQARQLVWRNRQGVELETVGPRQSGLLEPELSPDGRSLAFRATEGGKEYLWVFDMIRGVRTRLTSEPRRQLHAAWSPPGEEIAYAELGDEAGIFLKRADGSGNARRLLTVKGQAPSWSPDGRFIVFQSGGGSSRNRDLWYVAVGDANQEGEPKAFLASPANEAVPSFSPDGKYVLYSSDEAGRWEVYVRPFPDGEGKWQLSANGGSQALWSRDGTEIFYVEGDTLMGVPVSIAEGFTPGRAQPLFAHPALEKPFPKPNYTVSPDAQKFLLIESPESAETRQVHVIENWYEEFRDRDQN